ncbi:hypothetical protein H7U37_08500 [Pseudoflavonifractor phocaeensis]|uniref:HlyD family efflux transporter periplasmic adaptor subunit n=1 Tax=Pseudoflavonifractor phocaeensis TaxID=1870988 RepID=UPI00195B56DD|nr:HlyD family efflux transporter periplasmic adaptor subunit [Pseudoflavonifractor phocaeensis]MBM6869865.1 hypothetical protein [Pseudoflavonifractor phocaeensis]MBM6938561.1 hypothetical protein [Pseudoflavonifractor phocaeensis]
MKQGKSINRIIMLALLAAILVYLAATVAGALTNPYSLVQCYAVTVDVAQEATGLLVREEQVIAGDSSTAELLYSEGEKVAKGAAVAVVYHSSDAITRAARITALEQEITQLQYALDATGAVSDNAQLNRQIIDAITALKISSSSGDFTRLEDEALELRTLIYQRADAYGQDEGGVEAMQSRLSSAAAELAALQSQASQDTTYITVDRPGIFSGLVDGWESVVTPDMLSDMSPSRLLALENQQPASVSAVGKLITDDTWYFVCNLTQEAAEGFYTGGKVTVRFSRDWAGEVEMKVERISDPENGQVTLVLSTAYFLSDTTLLRRQTVEIMQESIEGIRVPANAVRVLTNETTDEETGQTTQTYVTGVYALVGTQAEFKPVDILYQDDGYCVVATDTGSKTALRSGDQIILASAEIYDGMVIG